MNLVGTLITGRLIGWFIAAWALSLVLGLGGLWLYMDGSRDAAVMSAAATAAAKVSEACALEKAELTKAEHVAVTKAIRLALEERAKAQAEVDAQRDTEQAALRAQVAAERRRAQTLSTRLARHLDATPLPAVCRLDAERVRLYNAVRRGGADPSAGAARPGVPSVPGRDVPGAAAAAGGAGWHGERGWTALAGGSGWGDAAGLRGSVDGVPAVRAPWHPRAGDPLTELP